MSSNYLQRLMGQVLHAPIVVSTKIVPDSGVYIIIDISMLQNF